MIKTYLLEFFVVLKNRRLWDVWLEHPRTCGYYLSFKAFQVVSKLYWAIITRAFEVPWLFSANSTFESNVFLIVIKLLAVLKNFWSITFNESGHSIWIKQIVVICCYFVVEFSLECMSDILLFVCLEEFLIKVKWRRSIHFMLQCILLAWGRLSGVVVHLALNVCLQSFHSPIFFCVLIHITD